MRKFLILLAILAGVVAVPAMAQAETDLNLAAIAANQGFQSRVQYAFVVTAQAVYSEAAGAPQYAKRHAYAIQVIAGSYGLPSIALAVVANSTVAAEANLSISAAAGYGIPDADISNALSAAFNGLAGY